MQLKERGDTIVEVLIAIAVIGAVVGGAFVSARRSLDATQMAKERDQGVRLAETQIERIKANVPVAITSNNFCLDSNLAELAAANCRFDSANQQYSASSSSIPYNVSVQRVNDAVTNSHIFTVTVRWERAGGNGNEETRISYRIHP